MLVIGVAGGIASGKSLVTSCFQQLGAEVVDADQLGHEVLTQTDLIDLMVQRWGSKILAEDGTVDRSVLASIVFAPTPEGQADLKQLESWTHPRIGGRIQERLRLLAEAQRPAAVLDAPVMFKAGWDHCCDRIVFVDAPLALRQERARSRGWSAEELERREARQTPVDVKQQRSTDVIDNSKSKAATLVAVRDLWIQWELPLEEKPVPPSTLFPT